MIDNNDQNIRFASLVVWESHLPEATVDAVLQDAGIPYVKGIGMWEGQESPCWITPNNVTIDQNWEIQRLIEGQDAIMRLSPQEPHRKGRRRAYLVFSDGRDWVDLGWLEAMTEEEARKRVGWTKVGGVYWSASGNEEGATANADAEREWNWIC